MGSAPNLLLCLQSNPCSIVEDEDDSSPAGEVGSGA